MNNIEIKLDEAIVYFSYIFDSVFSWLRSKVFVIGVIKFDLFTLSMSMLALEIIWFFVTWIWRDE